MATLDIEGRRVDVDDSFLKLSPQQQNETVMHIAASMQASGHLPGGKPQRQTVAQPSYDPMGNVTGGTEDVPTFEQSRSPGVGQSDDILKSAAGGVVRGAAGLAGLPALAADYLTRGSDYLAQKLTGQSDDDYRAQEQRRKDSRLFPGALEAMQPQGIQRQIEKVTGPAYVPTTRAGKFASAATEFGVGGAVGNPANIARNIVAYGVVPGLLSEAGGQAFEGSAAETPARIAGAVAGGIGGALATRGGTAGNMIRGAVEGATPQQLDAAEQLFQRAAQAGTPISRAEAIQAVTNGSTRIGDLQHTVEGMGGMKDFYSQRPAQNEAAARRAFDTLSPPSQNPSQIGPQAGQAAESVVGDVTQAINRRTRPLYQAAEGQRVGPQVQQALVADPLYAQTLQEVRSNPALNRTIERLPDDSVGVIDLVQRRMREQADNARLPGQANTSNLAAANFEDARNVPLAAADTVTGSRAGTGANPPVAGSYEAARATQQQLRQQYLEPLMNGPIGKLASRDTTTKRAIEALFPENPIPNSSDEILTAVSAMAARNPRATRDLVRAHVESVFNEATQRMSQGGFNQSGGAKFSAALRGNPQQADNLEAAVVAMSPHGRRIWQGFNVFLENLEAQQFRQAAGSRTAFKIPGVEDLKSGGLANNAAQVVASGGLRLPQKLANAVQNWNVGRNLDDLSRLLTDPGADAIFRQMATAPSGSSKAMALTTRLITLAAKGNGSRPRVEIDTSGWSDGPPGSPR
jgi:hypothetical protein